MRIAFYTRQGGKHYLTKDIIQHFPKNYTTYVEPFIGAGHVFFSLPKENHRLEVINDLDKNIYFVLKDIQKTTADEIMSLDWKKSKKQFDLLKEFKPKNKIERLYRFLYLNKYSFSGHNNNYAGKNKPTFRPENLVKKLDAIKERLKNVVLLNQDYKTVIEKYDSENTFFYLDPPYYDVILDGYIHKDINPEDLLNVVKNIKGKFLLSYNDHPFIQELFKDYIIKNVSIRYASAISATNNPGKTQELLIKNYND